MSSDVNVIKTLISKEIFTYEIVASERREEWEKSICDRPLNKINKQSIYIAIVVVDASHFPVEKTTSYTTTPFSMTGLILRICHLLTFTLNNIPPNYLCSKIQMAKKLKIIFRSITKFVAS